MALFIKIFTVLKVVETGWLKYANGLLPFQQGRHLFYASFNFKFVFPILIYVSLSKRSRKTHMVRLVYGVVCTSVCSVYPQFMFPSIFNCYGLEICQSCRTCLLNFRIFSSKYEDIFILIEKKLNEATNYFIFYFNRNIFVFLPKH